MKIYEHGGLRMTLKEWAVHLGIQRKTLWTRLRDGMPPEKAFQTVVTRAAVKRDQSRTVTKTCEHCERSFTIPKCRDPLDRACSPECRAGARATRAAESAAARQRTCEKCGKAFLVRGSKEKHGLGRFCSRSCGEHLLELGRKPEARKKSGQQRKLSVAEGRLVLKRGHEHPSWKGGHEAYLARRAKKDPAERAEKRRAYIKAHPDKAREWSRKRRGAIVARLPRGTIKKLGALQRWKCVACCCDIASKFHVDHIVPLARGGAHEPSNIQLLCPTCNVRKSAKHPIDFMQSKGYLL